MKLSDYSVFLKNEGNKNGGNKMVKEKEIGFIGLGAMGNLMSEHLLERGYNLHIYDINKDLVKELEKKGAKGYSNPKEVAENSTHVICMLPNPQIVRSVVLGQDGIIEGIKEGSVVIDMGTVGPAIELECAERLKEKKADLIDAPVGKGVWAAGKGELTILAGGDADNISKVEYILRELGSEVIICGSLGSGQVVKLANNLASCVNVATLSELYKLANGKGIEVDVLQNALSGTAADSWHLQNSLPRIKNDDFSPASFKTVLANKDLNLISDLGEEMSMNLPITHAAIKYYETAIEQGYGDLDWSVLGKSAVEDEK